MAPRKKHGEKEQRKANHMEKVLSGIETTKDNSFKKRFPTLKKKAGELETLCNVSVGILCFGRDGKLHKFPEDKKEPDDITKLTNLINRFKGLKENDKKEMNLVEFLEEQERKERRKFLDKKFKKLSEWVEELDEIDALGFLESQLLSFKERLGLLVSETQKDTSERFGSGFEQQNLVCDYNNNNHLLFNFPNELQESFQFLNPEAQTNSFTVPNCHNFGVPELGSNIECYQWQYSS